MKKREMSKGTVKQICKKIATTTNRKRTDRHGREGDSVAELVECPPTVLKIRGSIFDAD
jgi:hypothetical protein